MHLSKDSIITLSVLAVVCLGVLVYITNPGLFKRPNTATNSAQGIPQVDSISAENQALAETVTVSRVAISNVAGGFVVINKMKADGSGIETSVTSSSYLNQGFHENLMLGYYPLKDRGNIELKVGDRLVVSLVTDDGDKVYDQGDTFGTSVIITLR